MSDLLHGKTVVATLAVASIAAFCAGCGSSDEVKELRKEVSQLKTEVRDLKRSIDRRGSARMDPRFRYEEEKAKYRQNDGTNGVRRAWSGPVRPSHEEVESRRKMMQDPEMRKKFEVEHRARKDERRKRYEERRREMEERRRNGKESVAPSSGAKSKSN